MKKLARLIISISIISIFLTGCTTIKEMCTGDEETCDPSYLESVNVEKSRPTEMVELKDGDSFELEANVIEKEIKGNNYKMYGYNSQVPGPLLSVQQGSKINVNFKNNIDQETTIHWHGLRQDIKNDGVPGISQDPVKPGETFDYEVFFPDAGIYFYHPHIREDSQQGLGLAGSMIVHSNSFDGNVNKEEFIVLNDMLIINGQHIPFGKEHANFVLMGRYGNVMLVNGETDYELTVNKGDVVRFYFTNVANVRPFNILIDEVPMKLIGSDVGKYEKETMIDNQIIAPAERYIIEVYFDKLGEHELIHRTPMQDYILGKIIVTDSKSSESFIDEFSKLNENTEIISDVAQFKEYFDKEIDYQIDLTLDMPHEMMMGHGMEDMPCHQMPDGSWMGNCEGDEHSEGIEWEDTMQMMNSRTTSEETRWILKDKETGLENMEIKMNAKVGDKLKIRLFNDPDSMHPMQHPIHLHGQRFLVLSVDGVMTDNFVWKDTVLVEKGQTVDILVDVTNPGEWMMHCHIAEHLEAGMMTSLVVE